MSKFPDLRLQRLRKSQAIRNMVEIPLPRPEKFIWPVFVIEGVNKEIPIDSMPGQFRYSVDRLIKAVDKVAKMGVGGVMVFGVPGDQVKSSSASFAFRDDGLVQTAVRELRKNFPHLLIFTDVCICSYTNHGHCSILTPDGSIKNDKTNRLLSKIAISHAASGASGVAPSAMMDGQIAAIRRGLEKMSFHDTILMSYSTKFASAMYGPFRQAADSAPAKGDRRGYQASPGDLNSALLESQLDEGEGADILMVKPSLFYLDLIVKIKEKSLLPVAAYNVSGEYSMLIASANNGWGELYPMVRESILALSRAGSDIIISYWANEYNKIF